LGERKPPLILLGSRAGAGQTGSKGSSSFDAAGLEWREAEWLSNPALYEGVFSRRVFAYLLDALLAFLFCVLIGLATCMMPVVSVPTFLFGTPVVHFILAAATIGGRRAATPGMRALGLRTIAWNGENPGPLRGIIMTAMFYLSVPATGFLILIFGFFDPRGRLLHDHLAGILVYRAEAAAGRI
jgi:uncharacterized RDD family membrane protein YckC